MRSVAAQAGVGERTIYRHFHSREGLLRATADRIGPMVLVPVCDSVDELENYAGDLFNRFESHRELTIALARSNWAATLPATAPPGTAAGPGPGSMSTALRDRYPTAPVGTLRSATLNLGTVLSPAGWVHQRISLGLEQPDVIDNARWLVRTVIKSLE